MNIINMARSEQVGDITVHASGRGHVRFVVWKDGKDFDFVLNMKDAVQLYRRLVGEVDFSMNVEGEPPVYVAYRQGEDAWTLSFRGIVAVLDQDDSLALAWGVRSVIESLVVSGAHRDIAADSCVWVLQISHSSSYCVKRNSRTFATRGEALDALREFMRPAMNAVVSEAQLDVADVDERLDKVITDGGEDGPWSGDGMYGFFEVTLTRLAR